METRASVVDNQGLAILKEKGLHLIRSSIALFFWLGGTVASAIGMAAQSESESDRFFENRVRPLLIQHCVSCHGETKQEGGLRLDHAAGLVAGGDSGSLVSESDWQESLLVKAIRYEDLEMPPKGKLPKEALQVFEQWIASGARWPTHAATIVSVTNGPRTFTDEERGYWLFQPMGSLSSVENMNEGDQHPIDQWIQEKLAGQNLKLAPVADRRTLIRRAYLDLLGVLPSTDEYQKWISDDRSDAYTQMIDELLADRRYGQRWGRFWLDLVRYAESDGYKQDDFRPTAYRYRDYVVRAFQSDKPYAQFVREQLAGDEIDPSSLEMRDATSFLRLGIYEYNQRDVQGQWTAILNDLTDVTGEVFLGLGYSCARCHDHKFDPLLQRDYYRLQAHFAALIPRDDLLSLTDADQHSYREKHEAWRASVAEIQSRLEAIEHPIRQSTIEATIEKFPPEVRPGLRKPSGDRDPIEKQLAYLAFRQVDNDVKNIDFKKKLTGSDLAEWEALRKEWDRLKESRPSAPVALTATDVGRIAPKVTIPGNNDLVIEPGVPSILMPEPLSIPPIESIDSTGRRLALANWIVDPENRLTWRVIVNRIWQHHFGRGLVENASDFGKLTPPPSHPELLDGLARWFAEHQGSFKQLHRLMMTSHAYRQQAYPSDLTDRLQIDSNNQLVSRYPSRRMDAEQIRDCMLLVSGELDQRESGPSDGAESLRRSIYRTAMRNAPDIFLIGMDGPDGSQSVAKRQSTTTPLQALMLWNSRWTHQRAAKLSERIHWDENDPQSSIAGLYHQLFQRSPTDSELQVAADFVSRAGSWQDFCHVLLNTNEFLTLE